ncbi:MAG: AI-2E family transporter [Sphingomonadaceae bacterium]|nr:AI-2E family transporter [Sphingomonadaceae bacterium]
MTERPPAEAEAAAADKARAVQMRLLVAAITLASLFVARSFLLELAWAVTLAIALWPLYRQALARRKHGGPPVLIPLGFTLATGLVVMMPIALVAIEAARDSEAAVQWLNHAQSSGIPAPAWIAQVPMVGPRLAAWWQENLATPAGASAFIGGLDTNSAAGWARAAASQVASRSWFFAVTLLALFVILRDGERLAATANRMAEHFYGPFGERFLEQVAAAVRAAVNGTILVAIGEGTLIGIGYWVTDVPRPLLFTIATIAFALLPLGAWAAFGVAAAVLFMQGSTAAAIGLFLFGAAVMLTGDNFVQPALIGNSIELPFLWTFIGAFGGLEAFGIVGLFLGPALLAAMFMVWKEWLGRDEPHKRRWRLRRALQRKRAAAG